MKERMYEGGSVCEKKGKKVCERKGVRKAVIWVMYTFFFISDYNSSGVIINLKSTRSLVCVCVWGGGSERADM